jgi:transcriptional regulator with XRE-family HTH domain
MARALRADSADECAKELKRVSEQFHAFREAIPHALRGEWPAVTVLVHRWHTLVEQVLETATGELPDLVQRIDDGFGMRTVSRTLSREPVRFLYQLISDVPFSPVLTQFGQDVGVGVVAIGAVRLLLPGWPALRFAESPGWPDLPDGTDTNRYRRLVDLAIRSTQLPLARIKDLFGLNNSEVAELFGVTRQAVDQWEQIGEVPASRREKLANLLSVGELLERKLTPGRLPLVARRRADTYGGRTMLDMVSADRDAELRDLTERAFDWAATA